MKKVVKCAEPQSFYLQRGQGPPGREPVISEDEQKKMMAYYYRKQEEAKVKYSAEF